MANENKKKMRAIVESTDYEEMMPLYRRNPTKSIKYGVATIQEEKHHTRCLARLKDGQLCGSGKVKGSAFCYFHDPELAKLRLDNAKSGSRKAAGFIPSEAEAPDIKTPEDVRQFCIETAHQIRIGELGAREGGVVSALVSHILKTLPETASDGPSKADQLRVLLMEEEVN